MTNNNLLKSYMTLNGISQRELAKELNISTSALSSKLTGKREFLVGEATRICQILHIDEDKVKVQIFLA